MLFVTCFMLGEHCWLVSAQLRANTCLEDANQAMEAWT